MSEPVKPSTEWTDEERHAAYRKAAKELWEKDGEIEVDDNAVVSEGDPDGAYVQAWVWVYKTDLEGYVEPEEPEENDTSSSGRAVEPQEGV